MRPTLAEIYRSWRYHRAIRTSLRANQRQLAKARRQQHTHVFTVFGADVGVLVQRCSTCGHTEEV